MEDRSEILVISKSRHNVNEVLEKATRMMRGLSFDQKTIDDKLKLWQNYTYDDIIDDIEDFLDGYIEFVE